MCVIVYKKKDYIIEEETLKQMWDQNQHGAGYMFNKNNKLIIIKGLMTFEKFLKAWKHHEKEEAVLHFRIKTYGDISPDNTHPFPIEKGKLAVAHNGSISMNKDFLSLCGIEKPHEHFSDTWHFTNFILKKLPENWHLNKQLTAFITNATKPNKFVVMDNYNNVTIINEDGGYWINNNQLWVSNTTWKPYVNTNYHSGNHSNGNFNYNSMKSFSIHKNIKTTAAKQFTLMDNTSVEIPAGSLGWVNKYMEYDTETNKTYWWIKFFPDTKLPAQITGYQFPYAESDMNVTYAN